MGRLGLLGQRVLARHAAPPRAGGLRLAQTVDGRTVPERIVETSTRLAQGRSIGRQAASAPAAAPEAALPRPPGMSEFAARWIFGDGPAEGIPIAGEAAMPELAGESEKPSFLLDRDRKDEAAAAAEVARRAQPVQRGQVQEVPAGFRLSRRPVDRPEAPPPLPYDTPERAGRRRDARSRAGGRRAAAAAAGRRPEQPARPIETIRRAAASSRSRRRRRPLPRSISRVESPAPPPAVACRRRHPSRRPPAPRRGAGRTAADALRGSAAGPAAARPADPAPGSLPSGRRGRLCSSSAAPPPSPVDAPEPAEAPAAAPAPAKRRASSGASSIPSSAESPRPRQSHRRPRRAEPVQAPAGRKPRGTTHRGRAPPPAPPRSASRSARTRRRPTMRRSRGRAEPRLAARGGAGTRGGSGADAADRGAQTTPSLPPRPPSSSTPAPEPPVDRPRRRRTDPETDKATEPVPFELKETRARLGCRSP